MINHQLVVKYSQSEKCVLSSVSYLKLRFFFFRYLDICRKLQQTYRMEPAGSHGVWSLDDYQFVPFIWGSSQLIGKEFVKALLSNKKVQTS